MFISYARTEREDAERIKARLEAMRLSVFLDVDGLDGGDIFSEKLDREVKTAGCVLGLWSPTALSRPWVQIECDIGKRRGVLVPVAIHPFRDMDVPAPFWNVQFVDLADALHDEADPNWIKLRRALARTLKRPDIAPAAAAAPARDPMAGASRHAPPKARGHGAGILVGVLAATIIIGAAGAGIYFADPFGWRAARAADAAPAGTLLSPAPSPSEIVTPSPTVIAAGPSATPASMPSDQAGATPSAAPKSAPADRSLPYRLKLERAIPIPDGANTVRSVAYSPDGTRLIVTKYNSATAYNAATGGVEFVKRYEKGFLKAIYSPVDSRIAASTGDNILMFWNAQTGEEIARYTTPRAELIDYSADGARVLMRLPTLAKLLDSGTGKELLSFPNNPSANIFARYSADGSRIFTIDGSPQRATLWNARTGEMINRFQIEHNYSSSLALSPDGSMALSTSGGALRAYNTTTGNLLKKVSHSGYSIVWSVEFSRDGKHFATTGWRGKSQLSFKGIMEIWDAASLSVIASAESDAGNDSAAAFSPDGLHVAAIRGYTEMGVYRIEPN